LQRTWQLLPSCLMAGQPSLFDPKSVSAAQDHRSFNNILQLADISRPWIRLAPLQRTLVDFANLFPHFLRVPFHEVLDQHRNILRPFAERRHLNRENVKPVKQVGSKRSAAMAAVKSRLVAAMTRTSVGIIRLPPTRSNCRSCSTRSNAIWVSAGSSPTSSRKIVPECAISKRPWRRCTAPVKAPFSWPKQLRRDQGGRNRRTVYADERLAGTSRVLVYGASNQFFSGAGFAGDKHRGIVGATLTMLESTVCRAGDEPTISSNMNE